ncbi:MAG: glycosyltransferase [Cyanobacteria bacterium J06600_6]
MDRSHFFVSVIIPVYNGAEFLVQTVNHVLEQNYHPLEIVVVDDGSTDDTAKIAQQLETKIRYFYQDNQGPAAARNLGIEQAKGNIIAFLDVDDLWSDNKLELQLDYLASHPEVDIVQGMIVKQTLERQNGNIIKTSLPYNYINLGCAIYRKSAFERVGLFDATMRFGEDVDWINRAWEQRIRKSVIDETTYFYRLHETNMTKGKSLVELGFVRVFKKRLDRLRSGQSETMPLPANFPSNVEYVGGEANTTQLKKPPFTLISNNSWSSIICKRLNYLHQSPLVNTYISDPDYLKLLGNLRYYLESDLTFPQQHQPAKITLENPDEKVIIARLANEIEIHFKKENSIDEVTHNWQQRLATVQWDNMFAVYFCDRTASKAEQLEYLAEYERLDFPRKVAFAPMTTSHSSTVRLADYSNNDDYDNVKASARTIDIIAWLNQTRGSKIQEYLIENWQSNN